MYLFEFNTDKMVWTKTQLGSTSFLLSGLTIRITDDEYFKSLVPIYKNIINNNIKLILVDHTGNNTYTLEVVKFVGYDYVNQKFNGTPTKETVFFEGLIRENPSVLTDINNYWLYIQYE